MEICIAHLIGRGRACMSCLSLHHPPTQFFLTCNHRNHFGIGTLAERTNWPSTYLGSGCPRPLFVNLCSALQGFSRAYTKPQLLMPTTSDFTQQRFHPNTLEISPNREEDFGFLYVVKLVTSKETASSLSELNGGILFALIGQNGMAIMKRLSAIEHSEASKVDGYSRYNHFRFQKAAIDTVNFYGPDVGQLAALWIAPQSGTWRLEEAIIDVLPCQNETKESEIPFEGINNLSASALCESNLPSFQSEEQATRTGKVSYRYVFKGNERLLGDNTDHPAAELTPSISQISAAVCDVPPGGDGSLQQRQIGLQEYRSLKVELLAITAALVALGTACIAATGAEELAKAFCVGGSGGIMYLFLLQKAVDGLPGAVPSEKASENTVIKTAESWTTSLLSTPLVRLSLVSSSVIALGKLWHGKFMDFSHPQEILAGVAGFLTSKVAIFLVVFRSMRSNSGNTNAANKDNHSN